VHSEEYEAEKLSHKDQAPMITAIVETPVCWPSWQQWCEFVCDWTSSMLRNSAEIHFNQKL